MPLLWMGWIMVVLKALHVSPVAQWPWWGVLSPFLGAVVWFEWLEAPLMRRRDRPGRAWLRRAQGRLPARFGSRSRLR